MIDWLRYVSLMDNVGDRIDAKAIRAAIHKTNYMVENRLKASCSVKYKRTRNIKTDDIPCISGWEVRIVSLAPELSLSTMGSKIPVIEVPEMHYPTLKETAQFLAMVGQMVADHPAPTHTIRTLGGVTKTIPNTYWKGWQALDYCRQHGLIQ